MEAYPFDDISLACIVVLSSAAYTDLSRRRIPNILTVSSGMAGIAYHTLSRPCTDGLFFSMMGLLVGGLLLIVPYLKAWAGGGDVKLLAAMGSWLGPSQIIQMFIYSSMAGGMMACIVLFRRWKHDFQSTRKKKAGLPYAIAIAAGYIILLTVGERL